MNGEWSRTERLALYSLIVAVMSIVVALFIPEVRSFLSIKSERTKIDNTQERNINSNVAEYPPAPTSSTESPRATSKQLPNVDISRGVITVPQGPILGDEKNGPYYRNFNDSLERGVAYKYPNNNQVYIYDGQLMHPVASEQAYFRLYGCSGRIRVIDCAPVYEMPSYVANRTLSGEIIR